jgi:hypothetical protein
MRRLRSHVVGHENGIFRGVVFESSTTVYSRFRIFVQSRYDKSWDPFLPTFFLEKTAQRLQKDKT